VPVEEPSTVLEADILMLADQICHPTD